MQGDRKHFGCFCINNILNPFSPLPFFLAGSSLVDLSILFYMILFCLNFFDYCKYSWEGPIKVSHCQCHASTSFWVLVKGNSLISKRDQTSAETPMNWFEFIHGKKKQKRTIFFSNYIRIGLAPLLLNLCLKCIRNFQKA